MLNPLKFISKLIKSSNQKELDRIGKIVQKINSLEESTRKLKDSDFPNKTKELKEKLNNGIIFFGNEARGISNKIKEHVSSKITIPKKYTKCESLNLSVSFGVIISHIFRR